MSINITNQISVSTNRQDPVAVKKAVPDSNTTSDSGNVTRQDLPSPGNSVPSVPTIQAADNSNVAVFEQQARPEEQQEKPKPKQEVITQAVSDINDYVQNVTRSLEFTVDNELGETIIKVIDRETEEVVRQIPSEEVVALARHLKQLQEEFSGGILIQVEA